MRLRNLGIGPWLAYDLVGGQAVAGFFGGQQEEKSKCSGAFRVWRHGRIHE